MSSRASFFILPSRGGLLGASVAPWEPSGPTSLPGWLACRIFAYSATDIPCISSSGLLRSTRPLPDLTWASFIPAIPERWSERWSAHGPARIPGLGRRYGSRWLLPSWEKILNFHPARCGCPYGSHAQRQDWEGSQVLDYVGYATFIAAFPPAGTVWIRDHGYLDDLPPWILEINNSKDLTTLTTPTTVKKEILYKIQEMYEFIKSCDNPQNVSYKNYVEFCRSNRSSRSNFLPIAEFFSPTNNQNNLSVVASDRKLAPENDKKEPRTKFDPNYLSLMNSNYVSGNESREWLAFLERKRLNSMQRF